jgi:hypothetical protein
MTADLSEFPAIAAIAQVVAFLAAFSSTNSVESHNIN